MFLPKPVQIATRRTAKRILTLIVTVVAILYFLVDALFLWLVRPFAVKLARLPVFHRVGPWVRSLGPYPTLVLFLVPVAILEPIKPLGLYLIGTGHAMEGVLLIASAELLKITLVERLFHMSRDKLLSIRWFARGYAVVMGWWRYLQALRAWQAVWKQVARLKALSRRLWRRAKERG
jgi:hypothetical protein